MKHELYIVWDKITQNTVGTAFEARNSQEAAKLSRNLMTDLNAEDYDLILIGFYETWTNVGTDKLDRISITESFTICTDMWKRYKVNNER